MNGWKNEWMNNLKCMENRKTRTNKIKGWCCKNWAKEKKNKSKTRTERRKKNRGEINNCNMHEIWSVGKMVSTKIRWRCSFFFLAFTRDKDRWFQCSKNRFLKREMPRQMFTTVEETKPRRDLAHGNVLWQQHKMWCGQLGQHLCPMIHVKRLWPTK